MSGGLILRSVGLGVGLAMDAFSVSIADGLAEPRMSGGKKILIAGTFAAYQTAMPIIGWACVHTVAEQFAVFAKSIPWIALILLLYIGGKMLIDGIRTMSSGSDRDGERGGQSYVERDDPTADEKDRAAEMTRTLGLGTLMAQGVATSIDALSVGFAFASLTLVKAIACSAIIGVVTFVICMLGLALGNRIGGRFSGKAEIAGGIILILIGIEIFVKGVFL